MHALRARLPKNFVLEERLERYADAIEARPWAYAGLWAQACHPLGVRNAGTAISRYGRVVLDMGCGKGRSTVEAAAREPQTLFVGIDGEPVCIAYAAEAAMRAGVRNVVFVPGVARLLETYFAPAELDQVLVNFPTPFPRTKEAHLRLTSVENLLHYRALLKPGGLLTFKTDSLPLWEFSKTQFDLAGFEVLWESADARAERPDDPLSLYEERLAAQGATVYALEATPGPVAPLLEDPALADGVSRSLQDYLPEDLESLAYVPHGMEGTVTNLRNRARKAGR